MLRIVTLAAAAIAAATSAASAQNYPWKPDKPITVIVPWAAGGSTDQVTRVAAAEIEKALSQKVVIVNQPRRVRLDRHQERARGAEGRLHLDRGRARRTSAPTSSAACSTPRSPTGGSTCSVVNVSVLGVNPNSPYKTAAGTRRRR